MTSVFNGEMARRPPKLRRFFGPVTSEIIGYYSRIEWPVDLRYRHVCIPVFQFLYGAIKGIGGRRAIMNTLYFNSCMVRLKAFVTVSFPTNFLYFNSCM